MASWVFDREENRWELRMRVDDPCSSVAQVWMTDDEMWAAELVVDGATAPFMNPDFAAVQNLVEQEIVNLIQQADTLEAD